MSRALLHAALLCAAVAAAPGCLGPTEVPLMGSARITSDFDSYAISRVGIVPFGALEGTELVPHEVGEIEAQFQAEFAASTPYELVALRGLDLAEVLTPEPFRQGTYSPTTIRTLRDRYRLDALLLGSVTTRDVIPPQVLGAQVDLVSCETGAVVWSASVVVDASRREVRDAVEVWARHTLGDPGEAP
ncbi:MAG: hypothetical protein AAFP22_00170, partial [Planctomycetota bacterium]